MQFSKFSAIVNSYSIVDRKQGLFRISTFPAMLSMSIPIVMREGKAFGLIITSGIIPFSENGIF